MRKLANDKVDERQRQGDSRLIKQMFGAAVSEASLQQQGSNMRPIVKSEWLLVSVERFKNSAFKLPSEVWSERLHTIYRFMCRVSGKTIANPNSQFWFVSFLRTGEHNSDHFHLHTVHLCSNRANKIKRFLVLMESSFIYQNHISLFCCIQIVQNRQFIVNFSNIYQIIILFSNFWTSLHCLFYYIAFLSCTYTLETWPATNHRKLFKNAFWRRVDGSPVNIGMRYIIWTQPIVHLELFARTMQTCEPAKGSMSRRLCFRQRVVVRGWPDETDERGADESGAPAAACPDGRVRSASRSPGPAHTAHTH